MTSTPTTTTTTTDGHDDDHDAEGDVGRRRATDDNIDYYNDGDPLEVDPARRRDGTTTDDTTTTIFGGERWQWLPLLPREGLHHHDDDVDDA